MKHSTLSTSRTLGLVGTLLLASSAAFAAPAATGSLSFGQFAHASFESVLALPRTLPLGPQAHPASPWALAIQSLQTSSRFERGHASPARLQQLGLDTSHRVAHVAQSPSPQGMLAAGLGLMGFVAWRRSQST